MEFITINNRANFLLGEVPLINPYSRRYITWWREQKKRCIDGFWSIDDAEVNVNIGIEEPSFPEQSDNWRYIPPVCYFYVNFGTIMANKKGAKSSAKVLTRPNLDDIEWEFYYNWMECRGFSGFEYDEEFSCNLDLLDKDKTDDDLTSDCLDEEGRIIDILYNNFFDKKGRRKKYVPVREYIRRRFPKNMGRPVYGNVPRNMMVLATRDGGKSYLTSGVIAHEIIFDGQRQYVKEIKNQPIAEIVVGAAISDKSRDLLNKAKVIMDYLPGEWTAGDRKVPSPFFKHMKGSVGSNKDYYHAYDKKLPGGGWEQVGTGSKIKHRLFTTENPEAAAGGRPGTIIVEEVGLMGNVINVHGGNVAAQNNSGFKFGSSLYIGTAGNIDKIIESEIIFKNPAGFDMLEFDDIWEVDNRKKICWFIPATHMARDFKDKNGNTKVEEAKAHFEKERGKAAQATTKKALETMKMNYPLVSSEMFVNADENIFPTRDIKHHYSRLVSDDKALNASYKVEFIIKEDGSIDVQNVKKTPIREFPLTSGSSDNIEGCPEIFSMPIRRDDGVVPSNVYIAGYDPIDDDDNTDITRSLQSFWIMNRISGELVFEYTGRTQKVTYFYEQCRRALLYYNASCNYENNKKGFYGHMYNKTSLHLLVETPEILLQKDMQKSKGGGNKSLGTNATIDVITLGLDYLVEWLEDEAVGYEDGRLNLHTIKSPALLRELLSFKPKGNFDRISALIMLLILREDKRRIVNKKKKQLRNFYNDPFFERTWNNQGGY